MDVPFLCEEITVHHAHGEITGRVTEIWRHGENFVVTTLWGERFATANAFCFDGSMNPRWN